MKVNIADHEFTIIWDGVYYFALSDYPRISQWELKKLLAFMAYEAQHGRQTEFICEHTGILDAVHSSLAQPQCVAHAQPPAKITECTACKQRGCLTEFVCHTASAENAKQIFRSGKLLSAVRAFDKPADALVMDSRNAASDPADFFEYVMFAWGNCQAGDRLVMERKLGRAPAAQELEHELTPGVRFYFRYEDTIRYPAYVFDGYHPAKVKHELVLADYLYACIVPAQYQLQLEKLIPPELIDKTYFLSQNSLGIWNWSEKVYDFIAQMC